MSVVIENKKSTTLRQQCFVGRKLEHNQNVQCVYNYRPDGYSLRETLYLKH